MSVPQSPDWSDANQRLVVAELARIRQRLGEERDADATAAELEAARAAMPAAAAIDSVSEYFALTPFERDVLLLCSGVEMDAQCAALCAGAQGSSGADGATFGLALAALPDAHWSALAPVRPLRRWRLVQLDDAAGITRGRLRVDERILHYLAGINYLDARLRPLLRPVPLPAAMADTHRDVVDQVCRTLERFAPDGEHAVILSGDDASGQLDVAAEVSDAVGCVLHVLAAQDVPVAQTEVEALATLWDREALLLGSALVVTNGADPMPAAAVRLVERIRGLVFVSGPHPQPLERPALRFTVNKPGPREQRRLWQEALGPVAAVLNGGLDRVASQFKLSARAIECEGTLLATVLTETDRPDAMMWSACRGLGRSRLEDLAQRIECAAGWDDLVLPQPQQDTLGEIASHVKNRLKVHLDWGFAERGTRGLGTSALFAGESGTGKTLAAEVLARELQLDLYRIDLSAVVSKYIGETEKNLRRVFDAAEDSGAVLLFDEADALFGKRSEVKDSHDRYANIEVSYLLQRMEAYRGLAVLTTNMKGTLDSAFQRRLRFVVQFPFPDQALRERIWRRAFPARMPLGTIDFARLARLTVTGGTIRNIAIDAAFRAAAVEEPLSMAHLLQSAHHDASKRERPLSDAETRGWA